MIRHPYHLVKHRPWPILAASRALILALGAVLTFHKIREGFIVLTTGFLISIGTLTGWCYDIIEEGTFLGCHTSKVVRGLKFGIALFILSEAIFFFSFFWAFFHSALAPSVAIGCTWPPLGIAPIDPRGLPLLGTATLIWSGYRVNWALSALRAGERDEAITALTLTVALGIQFSAIQLHEYKQAPFTIADSVFGSTFFVRTGFHGIHVLIGTIFLLVGLVRCALHHFSTNHHFGVTAAAWYWHFVDGVWIALYLAMYWWGGY